MRVLIKNGIVVNADGRAKQDLLIENGLVSRLAHQITLDQPCDTIDAEGCYVMPGGIDVHTHFNIDTGLARSCDDFFTGTRAAACGGTTTIIDHMGFGPAGCRLRHQLEAYHGYAAYKAVIDYSFHGVIQHINHAILDEIPMMVEAGISSFKLYLTYQYKLNDDEALQAMRHLQRAGALTTVHPENDAAIAQKRAEFLAAGKTAPRYHALSRPFECEAEAIARMINLAQLAGNAPLYIVHLSNSLGLDYLRLAQTRHQPVWVETCPQYLLLDERCYEREDALQFLLSPPLRNARHNDALWCGISDGAIDVVATDHCAFSMAQRQQLSGGDFSRCPNGLPGVENRLLLLFSHGVMTGRISAERFVALTSATPAKLFGLWPKKGLLAPGADGDVVIIDPRRTTTIRHEMLHDNADYSPWEGFICQGAIRQTLSHGRVIFDNGHFTGTAGQGRFLRRHPFSIANAPVSGNAP
ncbi:TPA: dihydropyrimidinase [Raoultella planticola]|jgi:dihydropyrimidinase|uniref:dihydropyrimidinase n=1 Tax=Raoultella planticola TaxID=575 RepID=UPI00045A02DB|nr:dihydropyrimidinase [Raoultella planticola]ELT9607856.1 dihydropyrimidinase [Raoultella planticola]KAJ97195.1 phenylhydantoinase [Raoultella planticola]KFD07152.1 putative hydrolase [Raoultella planticola ATCC 33531]HAT1632352.1 dihydropyrimidinase [Raoultella planticola]HDG9793728.1 dihydropyrimidinase [Raoultella planticola]